MSEHLEPMNLQTPLGRVRGLGSAKGGTHHWWMQRVTSMALLPLTIWLAFGVAGHAGDPWPVVAAWIGHPFNATLLILWIAIGFQHTASGFQVIIEDYIRPESAALLASLAIKGLCALLGLLSIISVLRLAVARFAA
ncbi:succinate dehydrogenase, hydrophobic membrane anchor protein [Muricoccus radiodurans]|uniref:succinate dehydrogenase, hydrophobic membrane anchor protein n=1 Tax=Muricoccus radiodurans TaxID=2231721 RepID=UPI003CF5D0AC